MLFGHNDTRSFTVKKCSHFFNNYNKKQTVSFPSSFWVFIHVCLELFLHSSTVQPTFHWHHFNGWYAFSRLLLAVSLRSLLFPLLFPLFLLYYVFFCLTQIKRIFFNNILECLLWTQIQCVLKVVTFEMVSTEDVNASTLTSRQSISR